MPIQNLKEVVEGQSLLHLNENEYESDEDENLEVIADGTVEEDDIPMLPPFPGGGGCSK